MNNPKVSIIIPLFNSEKYLHKCINSILAQTFTDFECILIDDCSFDKSPQICDEYSKKDKRIKSIHNKNNIGSSLSRKIGLDVSSDSDYIQFIDSDDWIEKDMIEKLYEKAVSGNYDIVFCDTYVNDLSGNSIYEKIQFEDDIIMNIKHFILGNNRGAGLYYKFTKRSIYDDIIFPNEGYAEDKYITLQVLHKLKNRGYMNSAFYHVYTNPNSQMRDISLKMEMHRYIGLKENFNIIIEFLKKIYGDNLDVFEPELSNKIKEIRGKNPKSLKNIIIRFLKIIYRLFISKNIRKMIWEKRHKL
jgi:glycosyltransferase involved in cell wall biosynthesis